MNYLWEVLLKAREQGIKVSNIRFVKAEHYSAYLEVSGEFLNQEISDENPVIEINPYYRFYDIFKGLYQPAIKEFPKLRESLTNLLLHQLAENDSVSGMTKEEYYKELLYRDLSQGLFGKPSKEAVQLFEREQVEVILSGILRQYQTGSSLDIFRDMMEELIPDAIVYHSSENFYEILIYVGSPKEECIKAKLDFLVQMFVELPYHVDIYYEYHFGIMGVEETMRIDEIALC